MPTYKTPDVYVEEISVFPPSVAEVETAVPAFLGYTERARRTADGDLLLKPTKIYSLKEFEDLFGFGYEEPIEVDVTVDAVTGAMAVTDFDVDGVTPATWNPLTDRAPVSGSSATAMSISSGNAKPNRSSYSLNE